jgi:hypothetical protein
MRSRIVTLVVTVLALALAVPVLAASKHGITPRAPKPGATVKVGSKPTFKGRVSGDGVVYIYVSDSKRKDKNGLIAHDALIQKAKRKGASFTARAKFFDYPGYWLNSPGTYYWQAHRINCGEDGNDCYQEGPIVKFKVR